MYLVLAVDPGLLGGRPVADVLLLEPQLDLVVGALHSVTAVDNIASNLKQITIDDASLLI